MTLRARTCFLAALALLTFACGDKGAGGSSADRSSGPAASQQSKAAAFISKEGRYEIDFGGATPKESVKDDPNGGSWKEAITPSGTNMVQYTDYADHAQAMAETIGFIPTREKDQIKLDKSITVDGRAGRDIELTLSSGKTFWIRFLIEGKRVYKAGAVFSADKRAQAVAFMESLKIVPDPAAPAAPAGSVAASAQPIAPPK